MYPSGGGASGHQTGERGFISVGDAGLGKTVVLICSCLPQGEGGGLRRSSAAGIGGRDGGWGEEGVAWYASLGRVV